MVAVRGMPLPRRGLSAALPQRSPGLRFAVQLQRRGFAASSAAAVEERLEALGVATSTKPGRIKARSQDYYWYSPVLRSALKGRLADIVVSPKTEDEVVAVLRECYELGVPVTPRGAGTGNYGQAVPLRGGVVLDLKDMQGYEMVGDGVVLAAAGQLMGTLENQLREQHGYELRFFPSTVAQATIGGFVAGGSCGVGSINYGVLRDPGNISALRVVTMEAEPRVLELRGEEAMGAIHAYGTNGIIVAVELPLAPAQSWKEVAVTFPDLASAGAAAVALCESPAIAKRQVCTLGAPIPALPGFEGLAREISSAGGDGDAVAGCGAINLMTIGTASLEAVRSISAQHGGTVQCEYVGGEPRGDDGGGGGNRHPLYEWAWNHTTLRALRKDERVTYLQCGYADDTLTGVLELEEKFGGEANDCEVMTHVEWLRLGGRVSAFGLPLVKWSTKERLDELIAGHNAMGAPIFNPHTFVLEDGGMKQTDQVQLDFKQENDPKGLLNPGVCLCVCASACVASDAWHGSDDTTICSADLVLFACVCIYARASVCVFVCVCVTMGCRQDARVGRGSTSGRGCAERI